jgi:hypothetical protein
MSSPRDNKSAEGLSLNPQRYSLTSSFALLTQQSLPSERLSDINDQKSTLLSAHVQDRVFPIRSVVNVEQPSPSVIGSSSVSIGSNRSRSSTEGLWASLKKQSKSSQEGVEPWQNEEASITTPTDPCGTHLSSIDGFKVHQAFAPKAGQAKPIETNEVIDTPTPELYTTRHRSVELSEGHMVITGIVGSEKIQRCEDEPIHIPGAVQRFGCLIAFVEDNSTAILDVRIVSEVRFFPGGNKNAPISEKHILISML